MGLLDDLVSKITDPYERKARLYPALLALLPVLVMVTLLYGQHVSAITSAVGIGVSCGGLYLMTNACRELGKRVENRLFEEWGGKPTTILLRHRDKTIEAPTKKRYHSFLATKINEPFPDKQQEALDPEEADGIYRSGVRWLLDHTRPDDNKKFELLFGELTAYGFRRNALGVKSIGLIISSGCILWALSAARIFTGPARNFLDLGALTGMPETAMASLTVSTAMVFVWLLFFTKTSVRTLAFTYAEMLLRACDIL